MLDRRAFLLSGLAAYGASARELFAAGAALQNPKFPTSPFTLGVCSGDPTPDGVVLWTRLAIDPLNGGGMPRQPDRGPVAGCDRRSHVARRPFRQGDGISGLGPLRSRRSLRPPAAHVVLVSVSRGKRVEPDRPHAHISSRANPASIGFASPSRRASTSRSGLYTAYQHMAEEDLDLVMHLGDYIYENAGRDNLVRKHVGGELMTVDDYRNRYAQYRSDPALRAVHAAVSVPGRLGRSRSRQQLRRSSPGGRGARRTVRLAARGRLQGVLRAHAPSSFLDSEGRAASALPAFHLRDSREHLDARHPAVPNGPAVRRQRPASLCGYHGPARDDAGCGTGKVADGSP